MLPARSRRIPRVLGWFLSLVLALGARGLAAQIPGLPPGVRPTPEQAREILQTRPDLVQQLRERIQASGLTPDQIRARLRAEGYPEDLLDPYLPGFDTTRAVTPAPGTLNAVRALGLLTAETLDTLQRLDSLRGLTDSMRQVIDSIALARLDSLRQDSLADSATARRRLKLFGIETFRRTSTRFQPAQMGPVDENYRLGPGDVLVLILTGDVESAQTLEINREGFIFIPQVGQIYAANLTVAQLEDQLYSRLGRVYSGVRRGPNARTKFSVTVSRLRNIQVFVIGDVVRPGAYQISAAGTVLTALYAAGGPTENGSFRRIEVRRGDKLVDSVDVYDYLLRGINRSDLRLTTGDVIFVPVRGGLVKVAGRVVRPAIYEIKPRETLRDVLQAAGGFDASALQGRVQIYRFAPADSQAAGNFGRVVIDVSGEQLAGGGVPPVPMSPGDSVTVFATATRLRDFVSVRGNVWVPGPVGYTPGMKLSDAIRFAGGPKPDVYLGQILVSRLRSDSSRVQLRSAFADSTGKVISDLALEPGDEIEVFSRSVFRPRPWVTIVGAVRRSGRVPYREGMTLRDAVLLADGLTEDASLERAEIARLPEGRPTGALAQTIRVPLDSSYLFRRGGPPPAGRENPGGSAPDPADPVLQPYDNVLILRQPGWELQRLVWITGEVKYPGRYALRSKTERLSDLIERAGGLTPEAYPGGIQFYRRAQAGAIDHPRLDASPGVQALPAGFKERVGVDLPRVLKNPRFRDNLVLAAGDSVFIPEYDATVTVLGAVNAPGPVTYTPGKNLDWYVASAGGYAQNGDRKRVYVTQPDGKKETVKRRWLLADDVPQAGPGAVVYVPTRAQQEPPSNAPAVLSTVVGLLGTISTVVIVALTR